ncbi:BCCT family transporter [Dermacoccus nishinomiyaensis]|uniref:BCCT family transporter n=1 Tax=Dermacoccus nishinomiyaensis TaxID=1274 RepID=UPI000DFD2B27|nr:BCCT family transporter [Dermacoccus nishinomiyaensis]QQY23424.1 BCCT family transporter [Dermacoccus nishinomiyaensis]STD15827.1 Glycine betaine transporter BetP [Dermacoccus nishinomiyaensis]
MQDEEPKADGPPGATPATAITDDSAAPETEAATPQTPEEAARHEGESSDPLPSDLSDAAQIAEDDDDEVIAEKLRRQGVRLGKGGVAPRVFWPALIVILAVAVLGVAFPDGTGEVLPNMQSWIVTNFGWYYMLVIGGFIAFAAFMGLSRYGSIKLGNDDEKPEFGVFSWFAMLFAAGMGIGLVFYGVGEPLTYATTMPKPGWPEGEAERSQLAMAQTFVHWGLHPWAIYAVIGLALAYAIHRRGRPISIRWALEPILGERVKGWMGDLVDILAIFGTVFGVATSLGLGVQQIASGLKSIGILDSTDNTILVILIVCITFLSTLSCVSGLGKGIKWLSNINLSLAGLLLISVLLLGPTLFLFQNLTEALGVYLANVLGMTFDVGAYTGEKGADWNSAWTIFYWGWWISWAPFVGVFIARISRGRTIREFIAGTLLVPTLVGFVWFAVMGGAGIHRQLFGDGGLVDKTDGVVAEKVLFTVLQDMPLGQVLSVIAILLVAVFFITSSDSGSLVVDMLASGGHPNPPTWSRVLWALMEGAIAIGLLLAGGLKALQAASLATALPFSVVLVLMCVATFKAVRYDYRRREEKEFLGRVEYVRQELQSNFDEHFGRQVDHRVDNRIDYRISRTTGPWGGGKHAKDDGRS